MHRTSSGFGGFKFEGSYPSAMTSAGGGYSKPPPVPTGTQNRVTRAPYQHGDTSSPSVDRMYPKEKYRYDKCQFHKQFNFIFSS